MELLNKPTVKDRVHYILAFLLTAVCGVLGLVAAHQIRVTILLVSTLLEFRRRGFRIADRAAWFVLGVILLAYLMLVEHAHRQGVTEARVAKARGRKMPESVRDRAILRWLYEHDLHLAVARFLRNALYPFGVLIVVLIINEILQSFIVT